MKPLFNKIQHENKNNERKIIMPKSKNIFNTSSLLPHLSYLKRKTTFHFTLIELIVIKTCY